MRIFRMIMSVCLSRQPALTSVSPGLLALALLSNSLASADDGQLRFNRDIRPILADKCFACHGPDAETVEAGLRLDLSELAIDAGAIVPADPDASEMVRRIFSDDASEVMPPPDLHKPLSNNERELLRRWIAEGAEFESHWAYVPLGVAATQPQSPANDRRPREMIDHLIDTQLQAERIEAVGTADRITLLRRLSFDLTGLPPTTAEVDAFLADQSEEAYAEVVDRLLESPRFGERMASYWLDLVRYADTVGYHGDQNVSQSPYRDYVIDAFNRNLPYDQFIKEQLAGDLLPNATLEQRVASGYNRLNQTTEEGGSQAKEYLSIYFADRVRNVSQVFMGSTLGCAQCHDHKFDPFTAKDFYAFGAFFADLEELGVYGARKREPMMPVPTAAQSEQLADVNRRIAAQEQELARLAVELIAPSSDWEQQLRKLTLNQQPKPAIWVNDQPPRGGQLNGQWDFVTADSGPVHLGSKSRRQSAEGLVQHFFLGAEQAVSITEHTHFYAWVRLDPDNPPAALMLQFNNGSWDHRAVWGSDAIEFGRRTESWAGYQRIGDLPEQNQWVRLQVSAAVVGLSPGDKVSGMAFTQFGGLAHWDEAGWITDAGTPTEIQAVLNLPVAEWTPEQTKQLQAFYLTKAEAMVDGKADLVGLQLERDGIESRITMTVVSKAVPPREIRILHRGDWMDDSGDVVQPAVPEFLGQLELGERRATRLDLANWLCEPDHPLTSRTMVNRLWGLLFGRGICSSVDDLGGQGTYPSNPELLDALAVEFVESGWDIKHLLREIVNSEAYRRSSKPTAALRQSDPYNNFFARQARHRIEAEMVRDTALAISGLLEEQIGGVSVRPYQPAGYYAQLNFPRRKYQADSGRDQYRRGLYTHWQRTFLHPMLKAFDAPSREECTPMRARSSTPLQALTLLNDTTFVESARVFAARILKEGGDTPEARIEWAYRTTVSRLPSREVADELRKLYENHLAHYQTNGLAAEALITQGAAPPATEFDAAELAAWTSVARTLLNLHETITRY